MTALRFILACSLAGSAALGCRAAEREPRPEDERYVSSADPTGEQLSSVYRPQADAPTAQWEEQAVSLPQPSTAVREGPLPLVHVFDIGAPVRVVDLTTGATLATLNVPDRTLVSVDARRGVIVGKEQVLAGPLAAEHRYGLYVEPVTPGVMRQGIGLPGDRPH